MHELSIAHDLVQTVAEALEHQREAVRRVVAVRLRVGALAGIVGEALEFCYEVAAAGTPLEGSRLVIKELPVVIQCPSCDAPAELPGLQRLRCPRCDSPPAAILQGKELEVESVEIEMEETPDPETEAPSPKKAEP